MGDFMNTLIINCGSSSQSFRIYTVTKEKEPQILLSGKARNVATRTHETSRIEYSLGSNTQSIDVDLPTHQAAASECLKIIDRHGITIDAIGHRFVHGGKWLTSTTRLTPQMSELVEKCLPLAPIHNPNSYSAVQVFTEALPAVPQFLIFDTAFHTGMPDAARQYALPYALAEQYGFQKYGFHGLSYQYVSARAAELMGIPLAKIKLIMCHLGTGGSSVAAFADGHSIETSMGYSPLPGLVMSTRCGDLDPEIVLELARQGRTMKEIETLLNNQSGLIGLSGYSSNLVEIIYAAEKGNERCRIAYEVYANRLKSYIGGYYWQLNGVDAIVFTDEVGTNCWQLREKVCGSVENLGIKLDLKANLDADSDEEQFLNSPDSITKILSMPTNEESIILQEVMSALNAGF
jgi:acetate kinase